MLPFPCLTTCHRYVDRFVSYCDYHPPYEDQNGTDPVKSFFNCRRTTVPRYYANHTYFNTWMSVGGGQVYRASDTTSNSIFKL